MITVQGAVAQRRDLQRVQQDTSHGNKFSVALTR
jgi:hypothetical protein